MTTLPKTICGSLLAAVLATAVLIGCETENGRLGPEQRAIRLETEGCGHASPNHGSGVLIGGDQVATVAHMVAGSSAVTVVADGTHHEARITAYDRQRISPCCPCPVSRSKRSNLERSKQASRAVLSAAPDQEQCPLWSTASSRSTSMM